MGSPFSKDYEREELRKLEDKMDEMNKLIDKNIDQFIEFTEKGYSYEEVQAMDGATIHNIMEERTAAMKLKEDYMKKTQAEQEAQQKSLSNKAKSSRSGLTKAPTDPNATFGFYK